VKERLQKILARAGIASRRAAERLILEGRVTVNGRTVTELGTRVDSHTETVRVDGRRIPPPSREFVYLALHKPRGYVTTLHDPEGRPSVGDLIRSFPVRVFPVGRLDYHSEGLLLLTNDGALAHVLMHPSTGVPKTYRAKVRGTPHAASLRKLERGVALEGRRALACSVRFHRRGSPCWVELTVVEGRKHLVRRMLEAIGHPVVRLVRVGFGGVRLGGLRPGELRPLTPAEVARLRAVREAGPGGVLRDPVISRKIEAS